MPKVQDRVQDKVQDELETIHLYVVRGEKKQPYTAVPLFLAFLCLVAVAVLTWYSAEHPYYEHERITVPAQFLPLKVFKAEAAIISTGIKNYPATYASGTLTLSNGSVLSETLPAGIVFGANNGLEVQTTATVFIPAGSAAGYGVATVPARTVQPGQQGNIQALAVNAVYGTALYVRNLSPFIGGQDAYSVKFVTDQDKQTAYTTARQLLASQKARIIAYLVRPCTESLLAAEGKMVVALACQFATFKVPSYMHVSTAKFTGKNFVVDVLFTPLPRRVWIR